MARYITNPTVVDAMQLTETNLQAVAEWCQQLGATPETQSYHFQPWALNFDAEHMTSGQIDSASEGDWVLHHEDGKFEVMNENQFEITYTEYRN
ncbi:hypothetical protein [Streptomyces sp. LS1784]|uniref:hypothetical protein n=1 Tax=Streptomyces sp. LS1784 TaxID=2851533 RepID=UPI001CD000B4|nr:hypothetical protein [Streptomyces sp. LS1784]